ncbi:MAG TPA: CHAT domain-containing protein [Kofleriaceae bacterium]|nr:CHAT domain-containing protein [Kofleriaceae bacterium]
MKKCKKHVILMLSANPLHGHRLALDREARAIQSEIDRSPYRDQFELQTWWAVEALDLLAGLRRSSPSIVHFAGHGIQPMLVAPGAPPVRRDIEPPVRGNRSAGLCFQRPDGSAELVSSAALKDTFCAVGSSVRVAVLNACYSEPQARALRAHVDCVIGTRRTIQDDAAIHFASGLYGGIAGGATIACAFRQGVAALSLKGLADRPRLLVRPGVDPRKVILAEDRAPGGRFPRAAPDRRAAKWPAPRVPGAMLAIGAADRAAARR